MADITSALQSWRRDLEKIRRDATYAAFGAVIEEQGTNLNDILWQEAKEAAESTLEFSNPIFTGPLKMACYDENAIVLSEVEGSLIAKIDMDAIAGRLESYNAAVEFVRQTFSKYSGKEPKASEYWKDFVYDRMGDTTVYEETIRARLEASTGLAPWWSLLDNGNITVPNLGKGGTAYPRNRATRFVNKAENRINQLISGKIRRKAREIERRLAEENFGSRDLLWQIGDAVANFRRSVTYVPGDIIQEIVVNARKYQLYITGASRLGRRLA